MPGRVDRLGPHSRAQGKSKYSFRRSLETAAQRDQRFRQGVADFDRQGQHVAQRLQQDDQRKRHFAVGMLVGDQQFRRLEMEQQRHRLLGQFRVAERIQQPRDQQRAFLFGQHVGLQAQLVLPVATAIVLVHLHDHVVQQADPAAAHVVDAVRPLGHQHQRPDSAAVEQAVADFVGKDRLAQILADRDMQCRPGRSTRPAAPAAA